MACFTIVDDATGDSEATVYTFHPSYNRATETVTENVAGTSTVTTDRLYHYDEVNWLTHIDDQLAGASIDYTYR